jgi:hypothetical protein
MSFEKFKEVMLKPLFDLIQFGSSHLNSLTSIRASYKKAPENCELICEDDFREIKKSKTPLHHTALFRLSDLADQHQKFIQNWLRVFNKIEHVFRLYFGSRHIGFQFPVSKFLNLIQALESYHADRNESEAVKQERERFIESKSKLKAFVPPEEVELVKWIDRDLLYRPTLRSRLSELVNETGVSLIQSFGTIYLLSTGSYRVGIIILTMTRLKRLRRQRGLSLTP